MAAAVAGPWRAPGLTMAPGGHLDSGIAIIVTMVTTITIITTMTMTMTMMTE